MAHALLHQYLSTQTLRSLQDAFRACCGPLNTSTKKAELIAQLVQACSSSSGTHEACWRHFLQSETKYSIKAVLRQHPCAGPVGSWGSTKSALVASTISIDKRLAGAAAPQPTGHVPRPHAPPSSPASTCAILVPAEASVPAVAARLKKSWIKQARRRLKRVQTSGDIVQFIRATVRETPAASVEQVRCGVERLAGCSFAAGAKYKFFYHQLMKFLRTYEHKRSKRAQPKKFYFHDDVWGSAPAASKRAKESENADQAPTALVPWVAP